jgi:uncharacterized protein (DUF2141 family)
MRNLAGLLLLCTAFLLAECVLAQTQAPHAGTIRVGIGGLRNDRGQVVCELFSSPDGFPTQSEKAVARLNSAILDKKAACEFTGLAPGTYAVSVFHDENSNGKLDRNFMGIPREGVGASNGAKGHFRPPKFNDAEFNFSGGQLDLKIILAYL